MNICLHSYQPGLYEVDIIFLISCPKLLLTINALIINIFVDICYVCVCVNMCMLMYAYVYIYRERNMWIFGYIDPYIPLSLYTNKCTHIFIHPAPAKVKTKTVEEISIVRLHIYIHVHTNSNQTLSFLSPYPISLSTNQLYLRDPLTPAGSGQ